MESHIFRNFSLFLFIFLLNYFSFREGRDGKRCKRVSCRAVAIVLERGTVVLAWHTNQCNTLPSSDDFLRSSLFSPYSKISKNPPITKLNF